MSVSGGTAAWLLKMLPRCLTSTARSLSTVYALSSGQGKCGVSVIRVSGDGASQSITKLTSPPMLPQPRRAALRRIIHPTTGETLDHGLVLWFPGPRSFTGEDCAELQVHGGPAIVASVLAALSALPNFVPAQPGEFTKRAFYSGKLDLTAIEGLADLIHAETEAQRRQALRQYEGALGQVYARWRELVVQSRARLEAYIDFSEDENIEDGVISTVVDNIHTLCSEMSAHLSDDRRGERLRSGLNLVILGEPNVGKSSFLNSLIRRPAAIVSAVPGTTRDIVETTLDIGGYPVILSDTAGLRMSSNEVEIEGMRRAIARASKADIVLIILDAQDLLCQMHNQLQVGDDSSLCNGGSVTATSMPISNESSGTTGFIPICNSSSDTARFTSVCNSSTNTATYVPICSSSSATATSTPPVFQASLYVDEKCTESYKNGVYEKHMACKSNIKNGMNVRETSVKREQKTLKSSGLSILRNRDDMQYVERKSDDLDGSKMEESCNLVPNEMHKIQSAHCNIVSSDDYDNTYNNNSGSCVNVQSLCTSDSNNFRFNWKANLHRYFMSLGLCTEEASENEIEWFNEGRYVVLVNKIDLIELSDKEFIESVLGGHCSLMSVKTNEGLAAAVEKVKSLCASLCPSGMEESPSLTTTRHRGHISAALASLKEILEPSNLESQLSDGCHFRNTVGTGNEALTNAYEGYSNSYQALNNVKTFNANTTNVNKGCDDTDGFINSDTSFCRRSEGTFSLNSTKEEETDKLINNDTSFCTISEGISILSSTKEEETYRISIPPDASSNNAAPPHVTVGNPGAFLRSSNHRLLQLNDNLTSSGRTVRAGEFSASSSPSVERLSHLYHNSLLHREDSLVTAAYYLHAAAKHLGNVTGQITTEEVLDHIFSAFCIGK